MGGQRHAPTALRLGKRIGTHCTQEAGWAPGAVLTGAENSPPPEFDPRTVQPIASRFVISVGGHEYCCDWVLL